jgi:hypothetical protein
MSDFAIGASGKIRVLAERLAFSRKRLPCSNALTGPVVPARRIHS